MSKVKITINPRDMSKPEDRRVLSAEEIIEEAAADWDPRDPGVGKAVLLPDGREVFNPVPMAPPVGYVEQPDMMTRMQQMLRAEMLRAKEDEEEGIDTVEGLNDFPEDDDAPFYTAYELIMRDDFPESPPLPEPGEIKPPAADPQPAAEVPPEPPK